MSEISYHLIIKFIIEIWYNAKKECLNWIFRQKMWTLFLFRPDVFPWTQQNRKIQAADRVCNQSHNSWFGWLYGLESRVLFFSRKHLGLQMLYSVLFSCSPFSKWTIQEQHKTPVHGFLNDRVISSEAAGKWRWFYGFGRIFTVILLLFLRHVVLYRFSSSTEQSSTRLMRRHRRRRRKPKASNMDRVSNKPAP